MASIPVTVIYKGEGFKQVRQDAATVDRELKRQSQDRLRMIRLQARSERAVTQELKQQIRDQQRLNRLTEKLNRDLEKQQRARRERFKTGAGAVGIAAGIGAAFAIDAVQAADAARVTESAFVNLSGGTEQATKNMKAMRRATRDLVSEQQQQAIANQLLGMRIVSTDEEMERVVDTSRRLGRTFRGLGAEEAANEFAIMMSNMSVARLDSFGIASGTVRQRIDELMEANKSMTREQAFFQATMEEAEKTLARLGPELETPTERVERLGARFDDLKVAMGDLLVVGGDGGAIGWLTDLTEDLTDGAKAWEGFFKNVGLTGDALDNLDISPDLGTDKLRELGRETGEFFGQAFFGGFDDLARGEGLFGFLTGDAEGAARTFEDVANQGGDVVRVLTQMVFGEEEVGKAFTDAGEAIKDSEAALQAQTQAAEDATEATEDNSKALEEAAEKLERLNERRRDFARDLIRIDEQAQEDTTEAWEDYFDREAGAWDDHQDKVADIRAKGADDLRKIDNDLQKDLTKLSRDLGKDLAKTNKDEERRISEIKRRAATEDKSDAKRRQIDALSDERLFNFELKQLAAEGNAAQIAEALERREIEEQIAREKAVVEKQIEDNKLQEEIQRVRDGAEERRGELRQEANERRQLLEQEATEEREQRKVELDEQLFEEALAYEKRLEELRAYREEKLVELENSKQEAIQKLGEELVEAGDLTKEQLEALKPVAAKMGLDVGTAFAFGIEEGYRTNSKIDELLGQTAGADRGSMANSFGFAPGRGGGRGRVKRFQHGGSFMVGGSGGPDSQLVQFMASPGEQVTVTPQAGQGGGAVFNINASGVGAEQLAGIIERKVNEGVQEFVDTVLVPHFS